MAEDKNPAPPRKGPDRLRKALEERFFLRFHMTLILLGVFFSALIAGKGLLKIGVQSMMLRYPLVILLSYPIFFLFIRLWLLYVRKIPGAHSSGRSASTLPDLAFSGSSASSTSSGLLSSPGGQFSGGGAGGNWEEPPVNSGAALAASARPSSGSSLVSDIRDVDLDKGGFILILLGILLALIFGVGIYLIYAAPTILSDAALSALFASSLKKASKTMDSPDWVGSLFKATRIPFIIVLVLSLAMALVVTHYYPHAAKLGDILNKF